MHLIAYKSSDFKCTLQEHISYYIQPRHSLQNAKFPFVFSQCAVMQSGFLYKVTKKAVRNVTLYLICFTLIMSSFHRQTLLRSLKGTASAAHVVLRCRNWSTRLCYLVLLLNNACDKEHKRRSMWNESF